MATEKLIVELDAKTQKLDSSLDKTTEKIDGLEEATEKADTRLDKFSKTAQFGGQFIAGFGAAAVTAGAALSTMVVMAGKGQMELEQLARQAKLSTAEFEALSFATRQYGVDGEQIADISKDIADKLGEFAKVGTGPFQDIADVIGMTKEEAQELAVEFENMSSQEVIGELVRRLEEAGASTNDMTFALESMGNDLSKLIPLFSNNGQELKRLQSQYNAAAGSIKLTREEAEKLKGAATAFDVLTDSLGKASDKILSDIAGPLTDFFNELNSIIPLVTQDIKDFIASFDGNSLVAKKERLLELEKELAEEQKLYWERQSDGTNNRLLSASINRISQKGEEISLLKEEIKLLEKKRNQPPSAGDGGSGSGGGSGGSGGGGGKSPAQIAAERAAAEAEAERQARIKAIEERLKDEETLLAEKLERELELVGNNKELRLALEEEFSQNMLQIEEKAAEESRRISEKLNREQQRQDRESEREANRLQRSKESAQRDGLRAASDINSALLEDNKAVGAGIIVADTAIGVQKALAQQGVFGFASAAAIAASGIAQLANLESAAKGGGSISGSGAPAASEIQPDLNSSTISAADASGSSSEVVVRFEGNGDEITDAIAKNLLQRKQDGAIS